MESFQSETLIQQMVSSSDPIDPIAIAQQGESPTSIILANAILISVLISSVTQLVQVIMDR